MDGGGVAPPTLGFSIPRSTVELPVHISKNMVGAGRVELPLGAYKAPVLTVELRACNNHGPERKIQTSVIPSTLLAECLGTLLPLSYAPRIFGRPEWI